MSGIKDNDQFSPKKSFYMMDKSPSICIFKSHVLVRVLYPYILDF